MERLNGNLSAGSKVLRFAYEHYVLGRPYPLSVTLNVTTACNLSCSYCDIHSGKRQEPPTDDLVRLIRALGDHTVHWNLTGGEPTLRRDLDVIVDAIKDLPAPTYLTMFSNGKGLRRKRHLVRRLDEVFLSLDGSREFHDRTRGRGAFDAAMDAMDVLAGMGKAYSATCVISKGSERELDFVFDLALKKGIKVGFIPVRIYSRSSEMIEKLEPTPDEMHRVIERVRRFPLTSNSPAGLDILARWPHEPRFSKPCKGGTTFFTLEADGRLYRCCERRPEHKLPDPVDPERVMEWVRNIPREPCYGCWNIEGQELNMMFHLQPRAMINLIRGARISLAMRRGQVNPPL